MNQLTTKPSQAQAQAPGALLQHSRLNKRSAHHQNSSVGPGGTSRRPLLAESCVKGKQHLATRLSELLWSLIAPQRSLDEQPERCGWNEQRPRPTPTRGQPLTPTAAAHAASAPAACASITNYNHQQMGACCSSPEDKYDGGAQGSGTSASHKGKHHGASAGGNAAKNTTPDFGLGEAYQVCARVYVHACVYTPSRLVCRSLHVTSANDEASSCGCCCLNTVCDTLY